MKKNLSFILLLVLLSSCATTQAPQKNAPQKVAAPASDEDNEYAYIKNSDFIAAKEIHYEESSDIFSNDSLEGDTLTKESMARASAPRLAQMSSAPQGDMIGAAIALCYQKRFSESYKIFDSIYPQYKNNPSYWNQVGSCFYLQNNMRKAILFYNKARDLNQSYAPAINNIGAIYLKQGKDQKALLAFKKASEINSFATTPLFNLGQLYLKYSLADDALNVFQVLLKQKRNDADVLAGVAMSYLLKGDFASSISTYSQIEERKISSAHIGLNYAVALKLAGKIPEAQRIFKKIESSSLANLKDYQREVGKYIGL